MASASSQIANWLTVARLPFTTVGVVPFCAGIFIAHRSYYPMNWLASILGFLTVFFICIGCYLIGEIYDQEEDRLTLKYGRSKFAGGTLLVANRTLSLDAVAAGAVIVLSLAALVGIYIAYIHSSWALLGLGTFGISSAVFYSFPPIRLVKRGLGEVLIALCYGWLTIVTGFASGTGKFPPHSWLFALPVVLSIFNVIYMNEFPDYESDKSAGKRNLVVQTGKQFASRIYSIVAVMIALSTVQVWHFFRSEKPSFLLFTLPVVSLSLFLAFAVTIQEKWKDRKALEPICGLGILLNHLVSISIAILVVF